MDLGITMFVIGAALALLCIVGGALGGIAVGVIWAYRRAAAAADGPGASPPDVVAAIAPIWRPKQR